MARFMLRIILKVVWAILTGRTSASRKAIAYCACAYCRGTGSVPAAPLFAEACPMCGGSGSGETYKEAA